jgi:hypothetical protein
VKRAAEGDGPPGAV